MVYISNNSANMTAEKFEEYVVLQGNFPKSNYPYKKEQMLQLYAYQLFQKEYNRYANLITDEILDRIIEYVVARTNLSTEDVRTICIGNEIDETLGKAM